MSDSEDDADSRRAEAEDENHEFQERTIYPIFSIMPASAEEGRYDLSFRDWYTKRTMRSLNNLTIDDCRLFCWKDCAIYDQIRMDLPTTSCLLDAIWQEWYPHRAMDRDVYDESFFAKNMCFEFGPQTMSTIFRFHEALCKKLKEVEPEIPEIKPLNYFSRWGNGPVQRSDYKIRDTFLDVFLVVDDDWRRRGVLVCWIDERTAAQHEPELCVPDAEKYSGCYGQLPSGALALRCPLELAMKVVVSRDPERARWRGRYTSRNLQLKFGQGVDHD